MKISERISLASLFAGVSSSQRLKADKFLARKKTYWYVIGLFVGFRLFNHIFKKSENFSELFKKG
ncbi:hypothetical protein SAMN02745866_01176 [Alteromonadaceae bacterium Bs31]|nr:hypothetical protein SAMN02745866_01176 [Alteromonadaceae bacterium Bs31]